MLTKSLQCVSIEVRNIPHYDALYYVNLLLDKFEREVLEEHQFQALDLALRLPVGGVRIRKALLIGKNTGE